MKALIIAGVVSLTVSGCATGPFAKKETDTNFLKAIEVAEEADLPVEVVETAVALPLPGQLKPVQEPRKKPKKKNNPKKAMLSGARAARMEPSEDGFMNAVQVYPYTQGALYRLYASPGQVSDIALQPGEELISVSAGDTVRWVVGDTTSGGGKDARAHVLVKPISADLSTNLIIATDRRVYHLELESADEAYMAALSWRYPQDELDQLKKRNSRALRRERQTVARSLTIDDLNFDYRIEGDKPAWRPVRVFDDGEKVFIQMPDNIATTDAPPLFVLGRKNETQLVNYRVHEKYYIVDRLFDRAELRLGEKKQTVVRIVRTGKGQRVARLTGVTK